MQQKKKKNGPDSEKVKCCKVTVLLWEILLQVPTGTVSCQSIPKHKNYLKSPHPQSYLLFISGFVLLQLLCQLFMLLIKLCNLLTVILQQLTGWAEVCQALIYGR